MKQLSIAAKLCALLVAISTLGITASAQTTPSKDIGLEVAGTFTYVHTNAPPGGCGCFSMFGGSGSGAYYAGRHFAFVGEFSTVTQDNVDGTNNRLTIASYLFGARVPVPLHHGRFVPYGQALVGIAHDTGPVAHLSGSLLYTHNVIAASLGGGLDYRITRQITFRAAEVDYFPTGFPNNLGNRQNNTRVSSGVAARF
jgi:peptidoglycan-associated lipoprotein